MNNNITIDISNMNNNITIDISFDATYLLDVEDYSFIATAIKNNPDDPITQLELISTHIDHCTKCISFPSWDGDIDGNGEWKLYVYTKEEYEKEKENLGYE